MSDRRVKPCAACGHGKSKHRVGGCLHVWRSRGATFMGTGLVTKYCRCDGYQPKEPRR